MLSAGTAENLSFSDFKLNTNKKLLFDVGGVFTGDGYIVYAMYRRVILAIYWLTVESLSNEAAGQVG